MKTFAAPVAGAIGFILLWQVAVWLRVADPILLPPPSEAFTDTWAALTRGTLALDTWRTVQRTMLSFLIATVIGVPLGVALGAKESVYRSVEFVVDFFRSTPASAMFPLFIVLFGPGESTKIAVAAFGAALVILFNAAYGVINARRTRVLAARIMGASGPRIMADVLVWEALPQILVGMRAGVSLALVIVVVAEMFIGSTDGLGHRVINAQMLFESGLMYGTIFVAGALGYALNLLFLLIEKRFVHWAGR
ncbi:NitT/TauT family transport system permease protein [Falsiroseomonas stagni DSM 19981]|uniref:NitT/TauT family transport system permease protein n=1 Tax=Falsiroseomonas stagni DSM 19981 TaxID=1123062 RepID=A0A1I3YI03_9PROT|nr:ABC transporter permease [Falsiroseomonas stagni]SFK31452.1 NitT/TauT family transport system permease protein [Falsiroseomonas stagni DSM 19981]